MLDEFTDINAELWPARPAKEKWSDETMVMAKVLERQAEEIDELRASLKALGTRVYKIETALSDE